MLRKRPDDFRRNQRTSRIMDEIIRPGVFTAEGDRCRYAERFPDPDVFRPERWLDGKLPPGALPFPANLYLRATVTRP